MMDELVTWLRAQLDEDERGVYEWIRPWDDDLLTSSLRAIHEWTERAGAERVLREVEAKRQILNLHAPDVTGYDLATTTHVPLCEVCADFDIAGGRVGDRYPCQTVRLLALPYADRPGYREEWKP